MGLFARKSFRMHSGGVSDYKIDCDALTIDDIKTIASIIVKRLEKNGETFSEVYGIPRGGTKLADALRRYAKPDGKFLLIVDDVFTTGSSMEEVKMKFNKRESLCIVIFARDDHEKPFWVRPVFQMWG